MTGGFLEWLILLLIALLFSKDTLLPALLNWLGFKFPNARANKDREESRAESRNNSQTILSNVQAQMMQLAEHFNHETTAQWDEVKMSLRDNTRRHDANEKILAEIITLFREIKEYGIKCRKD